MIYDVAVYIGRFQPFHNGHKQIIEKALTIAKEVVVIVGSSGGARTLRNPFNFMERRDMIKNEFPQANVNISAVCDYPYEEGEWFSVVEKMIATIVGSGKNIAIIGHNKDDTSYYLNKFESFTLVEAPNLTGLDSTTIRKNIMCDDVESCKQDMPAKAYSYMLEVLQKEKESFDNLKEEWFANIEYNKQWSVAPYPPVFVTVDSVVLCNGKILLVERKYSPGKGLWALPGGFLNQNERLIDGAIRELKEETSLDYHPDFLKSLCVDNHVFDDPKRSSRGRTITNAFFFGLPLRVSNTLPKIQASDDAKSVKWVSYNKIFRSDMFEDHYDIIQYFAKKQKWY